MPENGDRFEDFHGGLHAGYDASQTRSMLYLAGFLIGFVWGAVACAGQAPLKAVPREAAR